MNASQGTTAGTPRNNSGEAVDVTDVALLSDTRGPIRLGFWVLVVGFGAFLAWAAWAPLDEGVSAQGTVAVESRRKPIQHLQGGVIKELRVHDAQPVKAGDVLVVLDDATTRAGYETIQQAYLAQRAMESRLLAELSGAGRISFHPDVLAAADGPAKPHMMAQQQLFDARRAAQQAEMAAGEEAIGGLQAQVTGLRGVLEGRQAQARYQSEQLNNVKSLAADGFAPRNQALQLEQSQAELRAGMADVQANIQRALNGIAETRQRMAMRRQEYLKETSAQLTDVRREVQANQEKLVAIRGELKRTQIVAPMDGQIVGLQLGGVGGVVSPGQRLMDVVPAGETLILDVKVPPHVIDRVRVGDATEVRFSGFANSPQLVVDAKLKSLAGDAVTEQVGSMVQTYYAARVELTPEGLKTLGHRQLQPGMPAEVLIRTGERSLLTYLLHPLTKRIAAAMKEE
ncbi:HlyD family type I secretion periplasmic adaptor subunit [Inhella gelatinilytica]|uniref:Membrane fusion protein (MFP) family protein n=1 Tax=Inhella gelatinilytica TaxID=2795030 RepID=A0A931J0W6_9BURK|nr:HlyD family type I secretion periplasmic adaptor subunit [Inhella gelatinilytica]MBH9553321.1 HlyD family type I secretion periplasmic adaptor subunit [Inhella gelatinilytica]